MRKLFHILFLLLFIPLSLSADFKGAENWIFGDSAGLSFIGNTIEPIEGGVITSLEGCASYTDFLGNLVLYTNGKELWNGKHKLIANDLLGHSSATQSSLILPAPTKKNIYYVFTTDMGDYEEPPNEGLVYNVVDINGDNGNGVISEKNVRLTSPTVEKVASIKIADGSGYWIVTHKWESDEFYVYKLDVNGVNHTPQIFKIGLRHGYANGPWAMAGNIKISPDGKRLAHCTPQLDAIELFDFNNQTGEISNFRLLQEPSGPIKMVYGIEFSPDGTLLYATGTFGRGGLFQFDILSGNNSFITIANGFFSALQLAPDGTIFIAKSEFSTEKNRLDVITKPNELGKKCEFVKGLVELKSGRANMGLPNFHADLFFRRTLEVKADTMLCIGADLKMSPVMRYDFSDAKINWKGPNGFYSEELQPVIKNIDQSRAGLYTLTVVWSGYNYEIRSYADFELRPLDLPKVEFNYDKHLVLCAIDSVTLTSMFDYESYFWNGENRAKTILVEKSGEYNLRVVDKNGCENEESIKVEIIKSNSIKITPNNHNFGDVPVNLEKIFRIFIENKNDIDLPIKNINFSKENGITFSNVPQILKSGFTEIDIACKPEQGGVLHNELIIELENECVPILKSDIWVRGVYLAKVQIPDFFYSPGEISNNFVSIVNFHSSKNLPVDLSYSSKLDMPVDLFNLLDPQTLLNVDSETSRRKTFSFGGLIKPTNTNEYTIFRENIMALLSYENENIVRYLEFDWNYDFIETELDSGVFYMDELCTRDIRKITSRRLDEISISPNPIVVSGVITVATQRRGDIKLTLINSQGLEVWNRTILRSEDAGFQKHFVTIFSNDLPSGAFILNIQFGDGKIATSKLIISK